jgi:cytochrome bd ubiquinol oxidase subunit II
MFSDVMPSTTDPACSLTATNAYPLRIMTVGAASFTRIVVGCRTWACLVPQADLRPSHPEDKLRAVA